MEEDSSNSVDLLLVEKPLRTAGGLGLVLVVCSFLFLLLLVVISYFGASVRTPPAALTGVVMMLPFLSTAFLVWTFGVWVIAPDRRGPPFCLAVAVLWLGAQWGPAWPSFTSSDERIPLTVMEWNVERLWGETDDGRTALDCVRDTLEVVKPDWISFLEVSANELRQLSEGLPLTCVQADYLNSGSASRGGLAMCAYGDKWSLTGGGPQPFMDNDNWTYVFAEFSHGDARANALAVHLRPYALGIHSIRESMFDFAAGDLGPLQRLHEEGVTVAKSQGDHSEALLDRVSKFNDPTVVAGDFNSTRDMALHYRLRERLVDAFDAVGTGSGATVRMGGWIPLRVDYIYHTQDIQSERAKVLGVHCSDHQPIVAELFVPNGLD